MEHHPMEFDWCHLCGIRQDYLADIWYPDNAEHGGPNTKYIRICFECGNSIIHASGVLDVQPPTLAQAAMTVIHTPD